MGLAFLASPVMIGLGGCDAYRVARLKREGVQVVGSLVDSRPLNTGKGRTSHQITLEYVPAGSDVGYQKDFVVTEAIHDEAKRTGEFPVTFLPSDPRISVAGREAVYEFEFFAIGAGLLAGAFFVRWYLRRQMANLDRFLAGPP